jgi:hypothetical protein
MLVYIDIFYFFYILQKNGKSMRDKTLLDKDLTIINSLSTMTYLIYDGFERSSCISCVHASFLFHPFWHKHIRGSLSSTLLLLGIQASKHESLTNKSSYIDYIYIYSPARTQAQESSFIPLALICCCTPQNSIFNCLT